MKFTIDQRTLTRGLSIVQRAITSKAIVPELEGVLIEVKDNRLKLTGTDSEITSIETYLDCNTVEEGRTLVNARIFSDIIRKLPDAFINIEVKENRMYIQCMNSNFELLTLDPMEFPVVPKIKDDNSISISSEVLRNAIRQTTFAVGFDFNRRTLMGVYFEIQDGSINFAALDGYRLSLLTEEVDTDLELEAIVPGKALDELERIIGDEEYDVKINFSQNNVSFTLPDTVFYSQLIDGEYFNYRDIIRDSHATTVTIDKDKFQAAIERAELLARREKANLIKLDFKDNNCKILSNTELGSVEEDVSCIIEGNDQLIAFNSRYLLEGIRNMENPEIELKLLDDVNPLIIEGVDDEKYLYLVLPVRLA